MTNVLQINPNHQKTLQENIELYRSADRELKRVQNITEKLKAEIKIQMGNSTQAIDEKGHIIATLNEQERASFNKELFDTDYPNLYKHYTTISTFKVLRLK